MVRLYTTLLVAAVASVPAHVGASEVKLFEIAGNDAMQFDVTEMRVSAGQRVRLVLTNVGVLPAQAMAHNWVLFKPISQDEIVNLSINAATRPPEYLPEDRSSIIAHTKMLGPGEKDEIVFTAPTEPGQYPYVCTFPGHFAIMRGVMIVE